MNSHNFMHNSRRHDEPNGNMRRNKRQDSNSEAIKSEVAEDNFQTNQHLAEILRICQERTRKFRDLRSKIVQSRINKMLQYRALLAEIAAKVKEQENSRLSREYTIISGGKNGLKYLNLVKGNKRGGGSFRLEVDVRGYLPENIQIDTENDKLVVRAFRVNGRSMKILGIIAPHTVNIEDLIVHRPRRGLLLIEAP